VAEQAPHLLVEIVPRVARALAAAGDPDALGGFLDALLSRHPSAVAPVAMAVIRDPAIDHPRALAILAQFIGSKAELADLVDASRLESLPEAERLAALRRLQDALGRMGRGAPAYRCTNCGYASLTMQWQCPGCRSWESMRPEQRLTVTAGG
jgi:lipopolysaccharide biosynthesis regulator YciM